MLAEHMPLQICLTAAKEMCAILSAYVDDLTRLPCDIIFPIVLAAATLWQHSAELELNYNQLETQRNIDLCVKCLSIIGKAWTNAGECRKRLMRGEYGSEENLQCLKETDNLPSQTSPTHRRFQEVTTALANKRVHFSNGDP